MRTLVKGPVSGGVPSINAHVASDGTIGIEWTGELRFTIDTGFGGSLALPERLIEQLGLPMIDRGSFRLGTGEEVDLPVYWGTVRLVEKAYEIEVIPGDFLLGTGFLSRACARLTIDFDGEEVRLEG